MGMGNFEGEEGRPIVKYRDTLWSSVQKRLNRSRCRLGCVGLDGPNESHVRDAEGHRHGNQFWDAICYNWLCVDDSD